HTPLKTPTAVAAWLTEGMACEMAWLDDAARTLSDMAVVAVQRESMRLERMMSDVGRDTLRALDREQTFLRMTREQLSFAVERGVERQKAFLNMASEIVQARSPEKILRLGFAVVRCDGRAVTSTEGLSGKQVDIQLATGELRAKVY
ncbi:MAG: exodeoxyribonuclease VII large subunit, partial [Rikenellaceae bacterium]|nr:exodeoxyribonuclease VII large subunit [Rikenellaceae bacterium]